MKVCTLEPILQSLPLQLQAGDEVGYIVLKKKKNIFFVFKTYYATRSFVNY
jgi:hypothetical protein